MGKAAASEEPSFYVYPTALGPVTIGARRGAVTTVTLGQADLPGSRRPSEATNLCANQIMEYLAGKRTAFTVAVDPKGTDFQKAAWRAIANIPYGQTRTFKEVADAMGSPRSYRMVGSAVRANPLPLVIPAHRVVGSDGKPTGTDREVRMQQAFLAFEQKHRRIGH